MATNLKEYVRESIIPYLTKIKATFYTKTEVDTNINAKNATNTLLDGYTKPAASGAIGISDAVQTAIGKLEKGLEDATAGGGEENVQPDWNQSDIGADDFIKNKPDLNVYEVSANKGSADGYAGLDATGKVPASQLPTYVDDVLEFANLAAFPATGEGGIIYVAVDTEKPYRWSGSAYVELGSAAATGTSITAPFADVTAIEAENDFNNA